MPLNIIQPVQPINWQGIESLTNNLRENKLLRRSEELAQQALSGNPNALSGLYSVNPHAARFIQEQQQTSKKERQAEGMNYARGAVISLLQAPAEQRPQLWKQAVGRGKQEYGEMFGAVPDEYSDQAFNEILSRASEDKIISKVLEQRLGLQSDGVGAASQFWNQLTEGLTPEQVQQAREIKLGLRGRPTEGGEIPAKLQIAEKFASMTPEQQETYIRSNYGPQLVGQGVEQRDPTGRLITPERPKTSPALPGTTPGATPEQQREEMTLAERAKAKGSRGNVPTEGLKLVQEAQDAMSGVEGAQMGVQKALEALKSPTFELGPAQNKKYELALWAGKSDDVPGAREYAGLKTTLASLQNATLLLHKGVQTEGDATRVMGQIINNITDKQYVADRLAELEQLNQRAIQLQQSKIQGIYQNYGAPTPATAQPVAPPQAAPQAQPKVLTRAQAQALATKRGVPIDEVLQRAQRAGMQIQ